MAGFRISCSNCGELLRTLDDCEMKNGKIDIEIGYDSDMKEQVIILWCCRCENSTTVEDSGGKTS